VQCTSSSQIEIRFTILRVTLAPAIVEFLRVKNFRQGRKSSEKSGIKTVGRAFLPAIDASDRLHAEWRARTPALPSAQFNDAYQFYCDRNDKSWSHTDCASFCVMADEQITEALTYDQRFEQTGFNALLGS
jgi:hypothetical protein